MATMTAEQIANSLKPFADFAPAILAAKDIVKAAEEAEKKLPALQRQVQDLTTSISHLTDAHAHADQDAANAREAARVEHEKADAAKAERIAEEGKLADVRAQKAKHEQEIKDLHQRLAVPV